jgi:hypothetical protein
MGIFGFLSKAHIEQTVNVADNTIFIQQIESKIERENRKISDAETVLEQLDGAVKSLQDNQRIRGRDGSIAVRQTQKTERDDLQSQINEAMVEIDKLQTQKAELSIKQAKIEAEVGPLKYIAELIYTNADTYQLEAAVRWVIIILVFVFDPLALLLLIASNIGLEYEKNNKKILPKNKKEMTKMSESNILKIDNKTLSEGVKSVFARKTNKKFKN